MRLDSLSMWYATEGASLSEKPNERAFFNSLL